MGMSPFQANLLGCFCLLKLRGLLKHSTVVCSASLSSSDALQMRAEAQGQTSGDAAAKSRRNALSLFIELDSSSTSK
jgi:hypothetical protein